MMVFRTYEFEEQEQMLDFMQEISMGVMKWSADTLQMRVGSEVYHNEIDFDFMRYGAKPVTEWERDSR